MYKNERRFRDAIMPDVVTDGTKLTKCQRSGNQRISLGKEIREADAGYSAAASRNVMF